MERIVSLAELRREQEKDYTVLMEVPVVVGEAFKMYVLLLSEAKKSPLFTLHRYYWAGNRWEMNVDIKDNSEATPLLTWIKRDFDLRAMIKTFDKLGGP